MSDDANRRAEVERQHYLQEKRRREAGDELNAAIDAAVAKAVAAERERIAARVSRGIELLRASMKEAADCGCLGDALRRSVEIDGALLALKAIREGTE